MHCTSCGVDTKALDEGTKRGVVTIGSATADPVVLCGPCLAKLRPSGGGGGWALRLALLGLVVAGVVALFRASVLLYDDDSGTDPGVTKSPLVLPSA